MFYREKILTKICPSDSTTQTKRTEEKGMNKKMLVWLVVFLFSYPCPSVMSVVNSRFRVSEFNLNNRKASGKSG
jgi:hypothetical protein